jgi:hypothetical protein
MQSTHDLHAAASDLDFMIRQAIDFAQKQHLVAIQSGPSNYQELFDEIRHFGTVVRHSLNSIPGISVLGSRYVLPLINIIQSSRDIFANLLSLADSYKREAIGATGNSGSRLIIAKAFQLTGQLKERRAQFESVLEALQRWET